MKKNKNIFNFFQRRCFTRGEIHLPGTHVGYAALAGNANDPSLALPWKGREYF